MEVPFAPRLWLWLLVLVVAAVAVVLAAAELPPPPRATKDKDTPCACSLTPAKRLRGTKLVSLETQCWWTSSLGWWKWGGPWQSSPAR